MGFRLRCTARLGSLRFNFSSGGLSSISVGRRGASLQEGMDADHQRREDRHGSSWATPPRWEQSDGVTVKINTRTDKDQTLEDKVASMQALL